MSASENKTTKHLKLAYAKIQLALDIVKDKAAIWGRLNDTPLDQWTDEHYQALDKISK